MSINVVSDTKTDLPAATYVARAGVFKTFEAPQVDSGNISYGVRDKASRYFLKTAGDVNGCAAALSHAERVALLRNAVRLHQSCAGPGRARLWNVVEASDGPVLVYEWVDGELLGGSATDRANPASAHQRFRALPVEPIVDALDVVIPLHRTLAAAGWLAVDFYDGSLLYDFARHRMTVMDIDHYHLGPFVNRMGRMFGSERFMAPEEFVRGAQIDERTTVFTLGRLLAVFLSDGTLRQGPFRGPSAMHEVMVRACCDDRVGRFGSVALFAEAWQAVASGVREPAR